MKVIADQEKLKNARKGQEHKNDGIPFEPHRPHQHLHPNLHLKYFLA